MELDRDAKEERAQLARAQGYRFEDGEKSAKAGVRDYMRLFYARAERVDIDAQSRIRLPDRLKTFAELDREVVLLGVNDHVELWDAGRWDKYVGDLNPQFDAIAEQANE